MLQKKRKEEENSPSSLKFIQMPFSQTLTTPAVPHGNRYQADNRKNIWLFISY